MYLLAGCLSTVAVALGSVCAQPPPNEPGHVPDELIVQFRTTADSLDLEDAVRSAGLALKKHLPAGGKPRSESGLAAFRTRLRLEEALAALENHPAVLYAEPHVMKFPQATSNDPHFLSGKLWGMYGDQTSPSNRYGSQAGEVWAAGNTGSPEIYVAVLDQGIDVNHPDLAPNIGRNPGEIPGNGVDDDNNGYIDDVHGYDFVNNDNTVFDGGRDKDTHGTHVAGTLAARGGNGIGAAGVCWNVKLLSGKFLGAKGGTVADEVEAIEYFIDLKQRHGLNIVAMNASFSGGSSLAENIAVIRAAKAGILLVAAAGNAGGGTVSWPARYDTSLNVFNADGSLAESGASYDAVIAVAAIDSKGALASWSGTHPTRVDLGAPGVGILSTLPGGRYGSMDGTSMATPHVTGGCVLYASAFPDAEPWEIREAILRTTVLTPSLEGKTLTGGRLNVSGFHAR